MSEIVQTIILKAKHVQKIRRYAYFNNVDNHLLFFLYKKGRFYHVF
jgi:hypothetical protein